MSYGELSDDSGVLDTTAESTLSPASPNVSITKATTNTGNYLPGDKIEYNITVTNSGEGYAYGYTLLDDLSAITTSLANDRGGTTTDTTGSPFEELLVSVNGGAEVEITNVEADYTHQLSLVAGEETTLKTTITNNSNGNASNIYIKDIISGLEVDLSDGTIGDLFPNGWTITTEISGDNGDIIEIGTYLDWFFTNTS
ncbi:MAG: hypothetical protein ACTH29_00385 [Fusobacterium sp.]